MGFFRNLLSMFLGVAFEQEADRQDKANMTVLQVPQAMNCQKEAHRQQPVSQEEVASQQTSITTVQIATSTRSTLIREPDDLGTPRLPRPEDVPWLNDSQKVSIALKAINFGTGGGNAYYWNQYYVDRKPVEEVVREQNQDSYDKVWCNLRANWKKLHHPFWAAYVAGHFPDPQAAKDKPELAKEICVLDVDELKYRQVKSLIDDGVYVLGMLQNCLFSNRWRPMDINDRDKWHFRKVLTQYGLEVPLSDEPDPIPFAELYIGAVFGVKVTPQKRLNSYDFIQGDESLEDRVRRVQEEGLVYGFSISDCEDVLFYLYPERSDRRLGWALRDARKSLRARKILAGGDYPEARSAIVGGVDLDELEKIRVEDLEMSARAKEIIQKLLHWYAGRDEDVTLADVVQTYHYGWLLYAQGAAAAEAREYLYRHNYVIRPEDMPMDERTPVAYLGLPVKIWKSLYYHGHVETAGDLIKCYSNDSVFSLRDMSGIGKKSIDVIRARLVELGLLSNSQ